VECLCEIKLQDGGAVDTRGDGYPLEKISCPVPLRTGISREPDHRTLRARHSFLNGRGMDDDQLGRCHYY
jgi:hypothetical protein